ncbi:MAG TPA: endonuclease domain-containing protein [Cyclobacteriaceae bacterium]|nr:endonuclease domain-containing protein [Cyclobacteriaceae bacterium]
MSGALMFYGASPKIFEMAKELRNRLTEPEKILWEKLRLSKIDGYRFKAQHPISEFIVDFYCHKAKLIIEIDGGYHNKSEQREYDLNRSNILNEFGLRIIRFKNEDVLNRIDFVIEEIKRNLILNERGPFREQKGARRMMATRVPLL